MPLGPGFRIGPYEIVALLGAGGMGEVYRARDARLKRDVALKFLPESVAGDPERLARFEREAQALAALKHPHIATIHGMEEAQGFRALVLELVEGETLADRIARGPVPIPEAVVIARQIADALEAAHEQGIVHRDLKPANIQITPDGAVKVLDFGLARIVASQESASSGVPFDASMSPTITSPAVVTGQSVLMGTAAYMAPEQARGKPADKRADIWAFGVVLYEMLTGTRAFPGDTVTEVAGAVIHKELDLRALPDGTPDSVRLALRRCLQKDPRQRMRDMGDVRLALDGVFDPPASSAHRHDIPGRWKAIAVASVAAFIGAVLAGAAVWMFLRTNPVPRLPVRVTVPTADPGSIARLSVTLSPDGRHLAFVAPDNGSNRLWVYSFADGQSRSIAPRDTVRFAPLWSPDSQSLAFLSEGGLRKVPVSGGAIQTIAELKNYSGGTWIADDVILIAGGGAKPGVARIPASGGSPVQITELNTARETYHAAPVALPDRRHFLFIRGSRDPNVAGIYIGDIEGAPGDQNLTRLMPSFSVVSYAADEGAADGHLLYTESGTIMAQRFDPRRLALVGAPVRVAGMERVQFEDVFPALSASANGAVAYRRAGSDLASPVFLTRDGKESGAIASGLERAQNPRISPDGRSLALVVARELWKYDVDGRPPVKLTFDGALSPIWSRDGQRIAYEGGGTLRAVAADGSGKPEDVAPKGHFHPHAFTPDSREIVAVQLSEGGGRGSLVRIGSPQAAPVAIAEGGLSAALSPDGRWLAYLAETTGTPEIWVRPYPGPGPPIRVSPDGGSEPVWAKNGRELYYLQDKFMMAVVVDTANGFNFKPAARLFETSHVRSNQPPSYDVTPDGRFVVLKPHTTPDEPITVIFNWTEMLDSDASRVH
jgi:Tol biopolymer transport system component